MSIPLTQRRPQANLGAHTVRIESAGSHPLADEIAHKRVNSETSNHLEIDESHAERVSELLMRLRNLATNSHNDQELASRDQLAAADEYRALQNDLKKISENLSSEPDSDEKLRQKAAGVRKQLAKLEDNLSRQAQIRPSISVLTQLDSTIGQVEEYQTYLQQLRAAVDSQLMKPIGPNKAATEAQERHKMVSMLSDSQRQILESGSKSLASTRGLDPVVALQLLDSSD